MKAQAIVTKLLESEFDPKSELMRMAKTPGFGRPKELDAFTRAYIEAALWSTNDESDEQGGEPLDRNYGPEDISTKTLRQMVDDCKEFQEKYAEPLSQGSARKGGHDFWFTRNGHGAGFWDGDWPQEVGEALSQAARRYGECYLEVGDDGKIY